MNESFSGTEFEGKITILGELYNNYKEDKTFKDFIEYNDLGLPLAYFASEGLVTLTDMATRFILESWDLFIAALEIEDTGFDTLEDVFFAVKDEQEEI